MRNLKKVEKPLSSSFIWNFTEENFSFLNSIFSVSMAKKIIHNLPRIVETARIEEFVHLFNLIRVDKNRIEKDKTIDVNFPLIIVKFYLRGEVVGLPIDGWHRISKSLKLGVKFLPFVLLTVDETEQIRAR